MDDHGGPLRSERSYAAALNLPGCSERYRVRLPRRRAPRGRRALVLLQHLCGNPDKWDPALVDALAEHSRVGLPPSPAGVKRLLPTAT